jgi:hypothetical protein
MGTILIKSALNALKIEVFIFFFSEEIQFSGTFFVIDIF